MVDMTPYSVWFVTGSQHLYGPETLEKVAEHSQAISTSLSSDKTIPCKVVYKPVLTNPDSILRLCLDANSDDACAGIITWMHTFSPSKMWINGLSALKKPLLHLHTQFNRDIPWDSIDMDFMNLNQSAHGDREHGFIGARMRIPRKIVSGHWEDSAVRQRIGSWMRTAVAISESRKLKIARFGDNMREVAVTEGDKVEAQIKFGWSVNGYGVGDIVNIINNIPCSDVNGLLEEYKALYDIDAKVLSDSDALESVRYQAQIELGIKAFLTEGGFGAFTTTFEDLHGLKQLPGLAVQRLMEAGFGFGGEGDWKTAAMVRLMKIMSDGKGTSFMEDYTYHLEPGNEMVLGAHMLEVCPTITSSKPKIEVHPLGIGGKAAPARMVFDAASGSALNASLIDIGNRFRLIVNEVEAVKPQYSMPKLPVSRVLWKPMPSMRIATEGWILAGGAHHTVFSFNVSSEQLADWAGISGIECVIIDKNTELNSLQKELRFNEIYWKLS
jgi:L-arabinose isomerase